MRSWTNATRQPPTGTRGGVLRPGQVGPIHTREQWEAPPALDAWVEHFWSVSWDLASPWSVSAPVLTHPAIHLTVESGDGERHGFALPAGLVHGVTTRRFEAVLSGQGRVFGVRFRPGGWVAMFGGDARDRTDRVDLLAGADAEVAATLAEPDDTSRAVIWERWLTDRLPERPDPEHDLVLDVVRSLLTDRALVSVADLAALHGVGVRTLQRLLSRRVGVPSTWLVKRYRLHDAVETIQRDPGVDLAALAAELGWYDQAHFTRDFTAAVGTPPRAYAAQIH